MRKPPPANAWSREKPHDRHRPDLLLVLIGLSIPVGAALGVLGLTLDPLFSMLPLSRAIGELSWSSNNEFLLVAIPLFIMLGEVLLRLRRAHVRAMSLWRRGCRAG